MSPQPAASFPPSPACTSAPPRRPPQPPGDPHQQTGQPAHPANAYQPALGTATSLPPSRRCELASSRLTALSGQQRLHHLPCRALHPPCPFCWSPQPPVAPLSPSLTPRVTAAQVNQIPRLVPPAREVRLVYLQPWRAGCYSCGLACDAGRLLPLSIVPVAMLASDHRNTLQAVRTPWDRQLCDLLWRAGTETASSRSVPLHWRDGTLQRRTARRVQRLVKMEVRCCCARPPGHTGPQQPLMRAALVGCVWQARCRCRTHLPLPPPLRACHCRAGWH